MTVHVPLDSWYHEGPTAVIETVPGVALWRAHWEAKAAARALSEVDAQMRAIIGDGSALVLADGRGVAVLARTVRREVDMKRWAELLQISPEALADSKAAARVLEREVHTLQVAKELEPK